MNAWPRDVLLRAVAKARNRTYQPPEPIKPVPPEQWPRWAKAIGGLRSDEDKGVGDTVHRQLGILGTGAKAALKLIGVPCGCDRRRDEWNLLYPYQKERDETPAETTTDH